MADNEWLTNNDPQAMLAEVLRRTSGMRYWASYRKLRLFACACVRRHWDVLPDSARQAIGEGERFADAQITDHDRQVAERKSWLPRPIAGIWLAAAYCVWPSGETYLARRVLDVLQREDPQGEVARADLLREVFGSPYRPTTEPCVPWLTPTVCALARAAYENRPGRECSVCDGQGKHRFPYGHLSDPCGTCQGTGRIEAEAGILDPVRLAVLSDALEEAGCDSLELLGHLRSPGPHVRGCHILDLVLSKE